MRAPQTALSGSTEVFYIDAASGRISLGGSDDGRADPGTSRVIALADSPGNHAVAAENRDLQRYLRWSDRSVFFGFETWTEDNSSF